MHADDRLTSTSDKSMNAMHAQSIDWLGLRSAGRSMRFFAFVEDRLGPWPRAQFPLEVPLSG